MEKTKRRKVILSVAAVMAAVLFFIAGLWTGKSVGQPTLGSDAGYEESEGRIAFKVEDISPLAVGIGKERILVTVTAMQGNGQYVAPDEYQKFSFSLDYYGEETMTGLISRYLKIVSSTANTATIEYQDSKFWVPFALHVECQKDSSITADLRIDYGAAVTKFRIGAAQATSDHTTVPQNLPKKVIGATGAVTEGVTVNFLSNSYRNSPSSSRSWGNGILYFDCNDLAYSSGTDLGTSGSVPDIVEKVVVTMQFTDSFFQKLTALSRPSGVSAPEKQSVTYTVTSTPWSISQYDLLSQLATNMEPYIGESVTSAAYRGSTSYAAAFMSLLNSGIQSISLELKVTFQNRGTVTKTFGIIPSVV